MSNKWTGSPERRGEPSFLSAILIYGLVPRGFFPTFRSDGVSGEREAVKPEQKQVSTSATTGCCRSVAMEMARLADLGAQKAVAGWPRVR